MKKYRIYIDETGNSDLESSDNPNHRFLSLTGIITYLGYTKDVMHPEMEALKALFFDHHPDEPVIFHRKEMVNAKGPFRSLKDAAFREKFDRALLKQIKNWDYSVVTVLLDKKEFSEKFRDWKYDPYHYCLEVLLEGYIFFLDRKTAVGDVMIESRGKKEDMRLKAAFTELHAKGSDHLLATRMQERLTSRQIKVKPKTANVAGLQLADMIAHPSRRDVLKRYDLLQDGQQHFVLGDRIIELLETKYERYDGRIVGCGLKKLP